MANVVTQLVRKNRNGTTDNIFPIAGGMAADSITTAMLQDGSVTSDKVDFTTYSSSDEQVVGTWTNGKPIYRRVISGTYTPNNKRTAIAIYTDSTIDKLVYVNGSVQHDTGAVQVISANAMVFLADESLAGGNSILFNSPNIVGIFFNTNTHSTPYPYDIIIEYTKTTD